MPTNKTLAEMRAAIVAHIEKLEAKSDMLLDKFYEYRKSHKMVRVNNCKFKIRDCWHAIAVAKVDLEEFDNIVKRYA